MKQLLVLTSFRWPSPEGAAWSRILNYARALVAEGVQVKLASRFGAGRWHEDEWEVEPGIHLLGAGGSTPGTPAPADPDPERRLVEAYRAWRSLQEGPVSLLHIPHLHSYAADLVLLQALAAEPRDPLFLEKNEMEEALVRNVVWVTSWKESLQRIAFYPARLRQARQHDLLATRYDGLLAISTRIETWARGLGVPVQRVPILTHCPPLETPRSGRAEGPVQLGFFGPLTEPKEGVHTLLHALAQAGLTARVQLNLFGRSSPRQIRRFLSLARKVGLTQVKLHGHIPPAQVGGWMEQQELLLLPRPSNQQTEFGFSTKLAEYLASGRAVLATSVSDNGLYLRDGWNGFLAAPGCRDSLAGKLQEAVERRDELPEIGRRGRETAEQHFHYAQHRQALVRFLFPGEREPAE
jgi:glycosyltransferase involved in cell wall biosynthesis